MSTYADLYNAVVADNAAEASAQATLVSLQAQIAAATNTITTDATQATNDTLALSKALQTGGARIVTDSNGVPVADANGAFTILMWDHGTSYTPISALPLNQSLPTAPTPTA